MNTSTLWAIAAAYCAGLATATAIAVRFERLRQRRELKRLIEGNRTTLLLAPPPLQEEQ